MPGHDDQGQFLDSRTAACKCLVVCPLLGRSHVPSDNGVTAGEAVKLSGVDGVWLSDLNGSYIRCIYYSPVPSVRGGLI